MIVDDVLYFNRASPFEDGPIAQAVNDVTADGALYFASAGNEGNVLGDHVRQLRGWRSAFGRSVGKFAGRRTTSTRRAPVQVFQPLSPDSDDGVPVTLFWANRAGGGGRRLTTCTCSTATRTAWSPSRRTCRTVTTTRTRSWAHRRSAGPGSALAVACASAAARHGTSQLSATRGRFEAAGWTAGVGRRPGADPRALRRRRTRLQHRGGTGGGSPPPLRPGTGCTSTESRRVRFPGSFTFSAAAGAVHLRRSAAVFFPVEEDVRAQPDFTAADGCGAPRWRGSSRFRDVGGRAACGGHRGAGVVGLECWSTATR